VSYYAKIHQYDNEKLLAICDQELMGTKFEHNDITLTVRPSFYEVLIEAKNATSLNVMGKRACELLIREGYVHPDIVMWIKTEDQTIGHVIVVRQ